MLRRSVISLAVCLSGVIYAAPVFAQSQRPASSGSSNVGAANKTVEKAQVMVLGMYHFTAKNDVHNLDVDNTRVKSLDTLHWHI